MGHMSGEAKRSFELRREQLEIQTKEEELKRFREDADINHNLQKQEMYRRAIEVCTGALKTSSAENGFVLNNVIKVAATKLQDAIDVM